VAIKILLLVSIEIGFESVAKLERRKDSKLDENVIQS
jgi:hypothetical protein